MDFNDKNILITGATGLVGGNLAQRLTNEGANVVALVRSKNPKSYFSTENLESKATLAYGDLSNLEKICGIMGRYEIEYVFHLAAQPIVTTAKENPYETFTTNIAGTLNILEAIRRSSTVKSAIIASSDKSYGESPALPYTEDMPMNGVFPYDASKSCADIISLSYARTYGLPIAVTRCANIYGAGDLNFNRLIPGAIKAGLTDTTLDIRSDGKMVREYLHVSDVVDAYLMLADKINDVKGEAFNFTNGESTNVIETIAKVSEALETDITINILNTAKGEIPSQTLSCEKAKSRLGWSARCNLSAGLRLTIPWYANLLRISHGVSTPYEPSG
jgi:CDP-glucose 4,6-dehydratase